MPPLIGQTVCIGYILGVSVELELEGITIRPNSEQGNCCNLEIYCNGLQLYQFTGLIYAGPAHRTTDARLQPLNDDSDYEWGKCSRKSTRPSTPNTIALPNHRHGSIGVYILCAVAGWFTVQSGHRCEWQYHRGWTVLEAAHRISSYKILC